jgi:hypothetical protein
VSRPAALAVTDQHCPEGCREIIDAKEVPGVHGAIRRSLELPGTEVEPIVRVDHGGQEKQHE